MEKWRWDPRLETGIKEIDEQHRELLRRFDRLELAVYNGIAKGELEKIIEYLHSYIIEHLEAEEKVLRNCSYPDLDRHIKQHDEFRALCTGLLIRYKEKGPDNYLALEVEKQVRKWWEDHILKMDMAYVPFIKKEVDYL